MESSSVSCALLSCMLIFLYSRESIKRREFTDNLRESNLRLHEMDECAFTGRSSVRRPSLRRESLSDQGKNFHPAIQQQYLSNQSKRLVNEFLFLS